MPLIGRLGKGRLGGKEEKLPKAAGTAGLGGALRPKPPPPTLRAEAARCRAGAGAKGLLARRAGLRSVAANGGVAADEAALGLAGGSSTALARCDRRRCDRFHALWSHSLRFRRRMADSCSALGALLVSCGKLSVRCL